MRELFDKGTLRRIRRAAAATDDAVNAVSAIVHEAARTRTRRLILLTGVPGSGKTLVGLRLVHSHFIDDLAVPRASGKSTAPAVFLSGNGPLVEVLQYELRDAGGGGRAFVRGVKDYVKYYSRPGRLFVEFAGRIPEWCVVVGLTAQAALAAQLLVEGHDLRITRDLDAAKQYLRERYAGDPDKRFGLVASSRDRDLVQFGVANDFQATRALRYGPWYGDDEATPGGRSCRHLRICITEFGAQGLELDATLLAWGSDFRRDGDGWTDERARAYKRSGPRVRDPWQLRANAYRVLLTRARDATVVFVPALAELDATHHYLVASGFRPLTA